MSKKHEIACKVIVGKIFKYLHGQTLLLLEIIQQQADSVTVARTASLAADEIILNVQHRLDGKRLLWEDDEYPVEPNKDVSDLRLLLGRLRSEVVIPLRDVAQKNDQQQAVVALAASKNVANEILEACKKKGVNESEADTKAGRFLGTAGRGVWIAVVAILGSAGGVALLNNWIAEKNDRRDQLASHRSRINHTQRLMMKLCATNYPAVQRAQFRKDMISIVDGGTNTYLDPKVSESWPVVLTSRLIEKYHLTDLGGNASQAIIDLKAYLDATAPENCTTNAIAPLLDKLQSFSDANPN